MPRFQLSKAGQLDPLAPFKVLAVMCHPAESTMRERMVGRIAQEAGSDPRRKPYSNEQFGRDVVLHTSRAGTAGAVILTQLQLAANGFRYDLNHSIPLVTALLPQWEQPASFAWSPDAHVSHRPRARRKILHAIRTYGSVAHLWAAMIHGQQYDRSDISPANRSTLPLFLAVADRFLEMACGLPSPDRRRHYLLSRRDAWTFSIPPDLVRVAGQVALPFHPDQMKLITSIPRLTS